MCNKKKRGRRKVQQSIQAWRNRKTKQCYRTTGKHCVACDEIDKENCGNGQAPVLDRALSYDYTLLTLSQATEKSQTEFVHEFCRLSSVSEEIARILLAHPTQNILCSLHRNHSASARSRAIRATEAPIGKLHGLCVFYHHGCRRKDRRLRPLASFKEAEMDLDEAENFFEFDEVVQNHSEGLLTGRDVSGKYVCSQCLYVVTLGTKGRRPEANFDRLTDTVDRWVGRLILYAMEGDVSDHIFQNCPSFSAKFIWDEARTLRSAVVSPHESVRILRLCHVIACRKALVRCSVTRAKDVDRRTLVTRLGPVLVAKDIHLKKIGYRTRCYIQGDAFDRYLRKSILHGSHLSSGITEKERLEMLNNVVTLFRDHKPIYWKGDWTLNEEISRIPEALWRDYMLQMASERRRKSWKLCVTACGLKLEQTFPLCNRIEKLPRPSLEECLNTSHTEYHRSDLILCVRVLKVIEQVVFARSNSVSGPLTVCLSISGIVEVSPSFRSVHNALGLCESYNVTEKYRNHLISERERAVHGAWDEVSPLDSDCIPLCQFDNWDIMPLHAVKVDGKAMPKINGSLLQGILPSRKRANTESALSQHAKKQRTEWKHVHTLGDRKTFSENFISEQNMETVDQFIDIVFGLVATHKDQLVAFNEIVAEQHPVTNSTQLSSKAFVSFRTLLLSAFKPHGGRNLQADLFDQHVVYLDISRDPASDILTLRRTLKNIELLIRPRLPGRPMFVVVSGDQPTYKMLVEMWLSSWRTDSVLHLWLIPFPGFFHAEKQAMYSLCKEYLDGLGLSELAECAGLSPSQVKNIVNHSHARNNRALLFSMACALVIRTTEIVLEEDPHLQEHVSSFLRRTDSERLVCDESCHRLLPHKMRSRGTSKVGLYAKTVDTVQEEVISLGKRLRSAMKSNICKGANGQHFIETVLFGALLPTVGFHVLSRTGHTDVMEAFWFRLTYILHSSNHLKYQELAVYYGFLRGILPEVVVSELFQDAPGSSVMKVPSFTNNSRFLMDLGGWTYTHLDELLEMLMVRHLKSLSFNFLSHLENAASWLMQISYFRALARRISGASRAYGQVTFSDDSGEEKRAAEFYDRNAPQSKSVGAMLNLMRERGFLNARHRGSEWLINVFCSPPQRMGSPSDQDALLEISKRGKLSTALHASALLPEVFGPITELDINTHFGHKKFRRWTGRRRVPTPRQFMMKSGGSIPLHDSSEGRVFYPQVSFQRPKATDSLVKVVGDRRKEISKAKDTLHLVQSEAERTGDFLTREEAHRRWNDVHCARHLISPHADAYFSVRGSLCHPAKSRMLSYTYGRSHTYTLNSTLLTEQTTEENLISRDVLATSIRSYFSIQIDLMNSLHYRGSDGGQGTRLLSVVTAKMKRILTQWLVGRKAAHLRQLHLHIDDPGLVISQKKTEQKRRDIARSVPAAVDRICTDTIDETLPDFDDELVVPWSVLIKNRGYKDELASLHLLCAALAAEELATENHKTLIVYLHGGCFVIPKQFSGMRMRDFCFRRAAITDPEIFKDHVILQSKEDQSSYTECTDPTSFIVLPRQYVLVLRTDSGLQLGHHTLKHGESETRFIAVFRGYILPAIEESCFASARQRPQHTCVILSDDTDVFFILLLSDCIAGKNVLHVLNRSVHSLDKAHNAIQGIGSSPATIATLFTFAGCDFLPGTTGISHESFLRAYVQNIRRLGTFNAMTSERHYEYLTAFAYLLKRGKYQALDTPEKEENENILLQKVKEGVLSQEDMRKEVEGIFVSQYEVGSSQWIKDVRNFVTDCASNVCDLIPPQPHIFLQAARARFVVYSYWSRSFLFDLSPSIVGGCSIDHGFDEQGNMVIEIQEHVAQLQKQLQTVLSFCGCRGDCSTRRCKCRKNNHHCIGCKCVYFVCTNRVIGNSSDEGPFLALCDNCASNGCSGAMKTEEHNSIGSESESKEDLEGVEQSECQYDSQSLSSVF